ncbi:EpsI family protein [candidate division GN15 bacterium]|nr:EpsI family protein [candidate division GN15 bacterium]
MSRPIIITAIVLVIGGAFGNILRFIEQTPDRPAEFSTIPYEQQQYVGEEHRFAEHSYEILQADTTTLRRYVGPNDETYWLFIAYFNSQKYGSQIHSPKHCLPGGGWQILHHDPYQLQLPDGRTREINRLIIADRGRQQLMLYWFETRGGAIRSEYGLKWDLVMNSLFFRPTDAAIVRLTLPIDEDRGGLAGAMERARSYFATFLPDIEQALPFAS